VISALSCANNHASQCLNKPRTVPKSPVALGTGRAVCSADVRQGDFEPLEHSVYIGRLRLGRYKRIAKRRYAAYDARDRLIGSFMKRADALAAIDLAVRGAQ
jgi:hypothetical protein